MMNRIFMTREEAIHLLLEAHTSATDEHPTLIRSVGRDADKLKTLERLLLDVRAGRVDEFRIDANDSTHVAITD